MQAIHDGVQTCPVEVPKHEDIVLRLWRRLPEVELCGSLRLSSGFLDLFARRLKIHLDSLFCAFLCCLRLEFGCSATPRRRCQTSTGLVAFLQLSGRMQPSVKRGEE